MKTVNTPHPQTTPAPCQVRLSLPSRAWRPPFDARTPVFRPCCARLWIAARFPTMASPGVNAPRAAQKSLFTLGAAPRGGHTDAPPSRRGQRLIGRVVNTYCKPNSRFLITHMHFTNGLNIISQNKRVSGQAESGCCKCDKCRAGR